MDTPSEKSGLQEVEDRFEEELEPSVQLKSGILMSDLQTGEVEFEVSDELAEGEVPGFDKKDVYKYMDTAAMGADGEDSSGEEGDDEPFEVLARKMDNITPDGGVKKMVLKQGTGGPVPKVARVFIHYNAYLEYSDEPFDSTYLRARCKELILDKEEEDEGQFNALPGLCHGIRTMRKGEQARILIRHDYALGELGAPPRIPAKATLLYQVEILNIIEHDAGDYYAMTVRERKEAPLRIVIKAAQMEKELGGDFFKQLQYDKAFRKYRRAVDMLEDVRLADDKEEEVQQKLLLKLYLNCALCSLKLCVSKRVLHFCNKAVAIDNNNPKCHYYKGKALRQLGEFERARKSLMKAKQLKPSDRDIAKEFQELEKKMQQMKLRDQQFYKRMFGNEEKEPEQLKATENDKAIQTIDEAFKQQIAGYLDEFLADPDCFEFPFSGKSFTPTELGCIAALAKDRDLNVEERGEGDNFHLKLLKRKWLNDRQRNG